MQDSMPPPESAGGSLAVEPELARDRRVRERIGDIELRDGERDLDEVERVHRLGDCVRLT